MREVLHAHGCSQRGGETVTITKTGRFFVFFMDSGQTLYFDSEAEAHKVAQAYVGNSAASQPFPNENTYMYGPGDGTASVMVREELKLEI